jgi:hypothetical protein
MSYIYKVFEHLKQLFTTDSVKSFKLLNALNMPRTTWCSWLSMTGPSYIANPALTGLVVTLTVTVANKMLASMLAKAKVVTTLTLTVTSGPGVGRLTNTPYLGNYCWLLDPWPLEDQPAPHECDLWKQGTGSQGQRNGCTQDGW